MSDKTAFKSNRFVDLKNAASSFLLDENPDKLKSVIDLYYKSDYDYDEMVYHKEFEEKMRKQREESRISKHLLDKFHALKDRPYNDANPYKAEEWKDVYYSLLAEVDKDPTLLKQRETTSWIARSCVSLEGPELVAMFKRFWEYCKTEDDGSIGSILSVVASSLTKNGREILLRELTLDKSKTNNIGLIEAYRTMNRPEYW